MILIQYYPQYICMSGCMYTGTAVIVTHTRTGTETLSKIACVLLLAFMILECSVYIYLDKTSPNMYVAVYLFLDLSLYIYFSEIFKHLLVL